MSAKLHAFLVRRALVEAFSKPWFSISPLTSLASARGVFVTERADYQLLRSFHCVEFSAMPQDVRQELFRQYVVMLASVLGIQLQDLLDEVAVTEYNVPQIKALQA